VVAAPIVPLARDDSYSRFLTEYIDTHEIDIVFAGTQHELRKISEYRDRSLKAATVSSAIATICMDKIRTAEVLRAYRVRVPKTQALQEYLHRPLIPGAVVIKPNKSSSSRNIFRFNDRNDAMHALDRLGLDQSDFLVQERLFGEEYTCGCYIDRYSKNIAQIAFRRTLTPDGATFYGEIVHDRATQRYIDDVARALMGAGMDFGHINVQLILDKQGPCLFEVNGRLSSTEASKAYFGFNSCAAFVYNIVRRKSYQGWSVPTKGQFLRYYDEVYF
jgi:glutathione synthase/RimK-type ligase-like ATP-grasp enzyme